MNIYNPRLKNIILIYIAVNIRLMRPEFRQGGHDFEVQMDESGLVDDENELIDNEHQFDADY